MRGREMKYEEKRKRNERGGKGIKTSNEGRGKKGEEQTKMNERKDQ